MEKEAQGAGESSSSVVTSTESSGRRISMEASSPTDTQGTSAAETPCTSESSTSNDNTGATLDEGGSEAAWRTIAGDDKRAVFYMEDDDSSKNSPTQMFDKNIEGRKIVVGICAMAKKTNSKPMKEILGRLERFEYLQTIIFDEEVIKSSPVEEWPIVDALISFFSAGFPLHKAIEYKNLRKPYVVNDLEAQYALKDRREVYKILVREGIAHPRYAVMNREDLDTGNFAELEDGIEVNGTTFQRPFVEKPVCAEDHNVYIYFPVSAGGGCQRLFRKVGSRSSVYCFENRVRKVGSYIYEDFMPTDGTDVKVYTVGPDYAHAEARKSPALDGKVERDKEGKEVRYPVLLSAAEKMIARKVCMAFKQNVCGFDLLRASGKSYVCDVNGFSFVKNSTKYYDDCANVLGTTIIRALAPQLHIPLVLGAAPEDVPVVPTTSGSMMELRCVVGVIRHGDRTPKQKMKMEVKHKKFFDLFEKYDGYRKGHLKLKKPKQLQEVLDIARDLLSDGQKSSDPEVQEKKAKLRQLKLVLEMYEFSGINRKIQLKYQPLGRPPESSDGLYCPQGRENNLWIRVAGPRGYEYPKEPSLVLILKWGGELTPAGKYQAEDLGKAFRTLYPGGQGEFETPGLGFLRLHSTFRHDLKIYASDEGRVQMTAAAFTKGLLAFEGELTPILVSMVKSANTNGLLDKEGETSKYQHVVKERLMELLNQDKEFSDEDCQKLCPMGVTSQMKAIKFIKNPRRMCEDLFEMVQEITAKIRTLKKELKSRDLKLYHGESWELLIRRWAKLEKDLKMKDGKFDVSKIPDVYDCIKYDLQHNQKTLQFERADEMLICSKALADIVIPQEYGMTLDEKLHISQSICTPLMRKIHRDLAQGCHPSDDEESTRLNSKYSKGVSSPERFVRTRLYFTSESHIHSLLNMLRYGGLCDELKDEQWKKSMDFLSSTTELNYMTQIVVMMFEDPTQDPSAPERFHVELHFSPGAYSSSDKNIMNPDSSGYRTFYLTSQGHLQKKESATGLKEDSATNLPSHCSDQIQEDVILEELEEKEMFEQGPSKGSEATTPCQEGTGRLIPDIEIGESRTLTSVDELNKQKTVTCPGSPDPDIPEWDWGDSATETNVHEGPSALSDCTITDSKISVSGLDKTSSTSNPDITLTTGESTISDLPSDGLGSKKPSADLLPPRMDRSGARSAPIRIQRNPAKEKDDYDRRQSLDEKRSRSLEDKETDIGSMGRTKRTGGPSFRYSLSDVFTTTHTGEFQDHKTLVEKHYLTIHLPIAKDKHYHSISSLLYINPEAFKDAHLLRPAQFLLGSCSAPELSAFNILPDAFDGFNMVPSLKPLETLHNRLTMRDMDKFLSLATTTKFFTPVSSPLYSATPIVSPRPQDGSRPVMVPSIPSSSNSSAGPSSPASSSTPVDFMAKVKMFILDQQESLSDEAKALLSNQQSSSDQLTRPKSSQPTSQQRLSPQGGGGKQQEDSHHSCSDLGIGIISPSQVITKGIQLQRPDGTALKDWNHVDDPVADLSAQLHKPLDPSTGLSISCNSQSAFHTIVKTRPEQKAGTSQRSPVFHVTQVAEDSLPKSARRDAQSKSPSNPKPVSSAQSQSEATQTPDTE